MYGTYIKKALPEDPGQRNAAIKTRIIEIKKYIATSLAGSKKSASDLYKKLEKKVKELQKKLDKAWTGKAKIKKELYTAQVLERLALTLSATVDKVFNDRDKLSNDSLAKAINKAVSKK